MSGAGGRMRVVFMGKDKPSAIEALEHLAGRGADVAAVVAPTGPAARPGPRLGDAARRLGLPLRTDAALYRRLAGEPAEPGEADLALENVDLVLSFLFWKRIRRPLIELPRIGCVNFHPAPLPDFRGLGGYNVAILEALSEWGVSAHFVDESFDTGDVIAVRRFAIDPDVETAYSLEQTSQRALVALFRDVVARAEEEGRLEGEPQGEGRYVGAEDVERMKRVRPDDPPGLVDRKIRAFWYPPYRGASIELGGRVYTLASDEVLAEAAAKYHGE